jgi:hypothetical protein
LDHRDLQPAFGLEAYEAVAAFVAYPVAIHAGVIARLEPVYAAAMVMDID